LTYYRYFYVYSKLPFRSEFFRLLLDYFLYAVFKEHDSNTMFEVRALPWMAKCRDVLGVTVARRHCLRTY